MREASTDERARGILPKGRPQGGGSTAEVDWKDVLDIECPQTAAAGTWKGALDIEVATTIGYIQEGYAVACLPRESTLSRPA